MADLFISGYGFSVTIIIPTRKAHQNMTGTSQTLEEFWLEYRGYTYVDLETLHLCSEEGLGSLNHPGYEDHYEYHYSIDRYSNEELVRILLTRSSLGEIMAMVQSIADKP